MGRPSKLADKQWEQIGKRLLAGEKAAALAREFKVSPASISQRFSKSTEKVKGVANQILETESALKSLSVPEQISAINLADTLRSISGHLARAANFGAATAHRLAGIANQQVLKVDDAEPEKSTQELARIAALTKLANEAGSMGLNLLAANKDQVKLANQDVPVTPVKIVIQVEDASLPEPQAQ
jgi:hypothetical protein